MSIRYLDVKAKWCIFLETKFLITRSNPILQCRISRNCAITVIEIFWCSVLFENIYFPPMNSFFLLLIILIDLFLCSIIPDYLDFNDSCIGRSLTAGYTLLGKKKHKNRSPPPPTPPPGLFVQTLIVKNAVYNPKKNVSRIIFLVCVLYHLYQNWGSFVGDKI